MTTYFLDYSTVRHVEDADKESNTNFIKPRLLNFTVKNFTICFTVHVLNYGKSPHR